MTKWKMSSLNLEYRVLYLEGKKSKSYEARFISFFLFPMIKLSRHYIERGKKAGFWSLGRGDREKKSMVTILRLSDCLSRGLSSPYPITLR